MIIALCHGQLYQKRFQKGYMRKMFVLDSFKNETLVLKKILLIQIDSRENEHQTTKYHMLGKMISMWEL